MDEPHLHSPSSTAVYATVVSPTVIIPVCDSRAKAEKLSSGR